MYIEGKNSVESELLKLELLFTYDVNEAYLILFFDFPFINIFLIESQRIKILKYIQFIIIIKLYIIIKFKTDLFWKIINY